MTKKPRTSGIDIIGDVPWGTHFCQLYQTKEDLMDILIPYFKAGLEKNEFCIWVTSQPLETEEATEALRNAVPDFDAYLEKGQIEFIHYTDRHVKDGVFSSEEFLNCWIKKLNQALKSGYDGLRLNINFSGLEMKKGNRENFTDYKKRVDAVISNSRMIALCTYPLEVCSVTEVIDIVANHRFTLVKKEGKWDLIENSGRKNIAESKKAEEKPSRHERCAGPKLESTLSPDREIDKLELAEIVDVRAIQSLMDDFHKFANITIGLVDLKGNVLVGVGWQDICTRFHRIHPEACKHCIESDTKLSAGVDPGEFKLYRCENNMWDVATPIMVGNRHLGNIFSGQFFFEDEVPDYKLFRAQARKYGFNEEEYIAALDKVPRLSREYVNTSMSFFMKFAHMISQLSYSNIKLAQSLKERDSLVDALLESEERFRLVLKNSLDAVYRRNLRTDSYDYMSPAIEQISGFSIREMSAMSIDEFLSHIHPADLHLVTEGLTRSLDTGHGTLEYRFKCKDGKYHWFADYFTVVRDQNSVPLFRGGIIRDITEKKQSEEALIRSENKFRTLAENSPDLIGRFDRQKRHMYVNPASVEPYGLSPEEIIGKTNGELGIDPELVKFLERHYENVFATGIPETMEFHYRSPSGKEYYFNTKIVPEFLDGEVSSVLAISRDITDIKEAEAKLKEAYDNLEKLVEERTLQLEKAYNLLKESESGLAEAQKMAHIGNWEWNIVTDEVYWSDEMYCIFGLKPQEFSPGYNEFLSYVHPDDRDYVNSLIEQARNGKPCSLDCRIVWANGEERSVHIRSEFIYNYENVPVRIKGIVQDITERKKAEKTLVNFEIARKKEIHHRIKNNLQVISSLLDLQAENFSNRKCVTDSEVLNAFRESQNRIMSIALIHEELHEGGGDNTLYFSPYLKKLVENLFRTYSLGNADINLKAELEEKTFFDMDIAVPLGIIVNELVSNSLKHAFPGRNKGEIQVKLFKERNNLTEDSGNELNNHEEKLTGKRRGYTLIVSDNGVGIPEKINFENSDTLGLQLVNILVDQLDGEIELKRDKGTEVKIRINV